MLRLSWKAVCVVSWYLNHLLLSSWPVVYCVCVFWFSCVLGQRLKRRLKLTNLLPLWSLSHFLVKHIVLISVSSTLLFKLIILLKLVFEVHNLHQLQLEYLIDQLDFGWYMIIFNDGYGPIRKSGWYIKVILYYFLPMRTVQHDGFELLEIWLESL